MMVVPWVLYAFPILCIAGYMILLYFAPAVKQVNRIESVTKSPMLSFFSETISGASTIRAFKKESEFILKNNQILNKSILSS